MCSITRAPILIRRSRIVANSAVVPQAMAYRGGKAAEQKGAVIAKIDAGAPAERAGLKVDDVVTEIGTTPVRNASDPGIAARF